MLKDYLIKIQKTTDQSLNIVPYVFETFYTTLKICCNNIPEKDVTPHLIEQFANIYKFYKTKIPIQTQFHSDKLQNQLSDLLSPFNKYIPNNQVSKLIQKHFHNIELLQNINSQRIKADQLVKLYREKGNKIHVKGNHQLSYVFWVNNFKTDYAVHFDIFWNLFLEYMEKINYFSMFVSESSKWKIKEVVDPDRKYYITSVNSNQLFVKLSQPEFLNQLASETSLKNKSQQLQSISNLQLIYRKLSEGEMLTIQKGNSMFMSNSVTTNIGSNYSSNFPQGQVIIANGYNLKCTINSKETMETLQKQEIIVNCKYSPTIRFGSLLDNQFSIKSPYISRKQFMIIEEKMIPDNPQEITQKQQQKEVETNTNGRFSLVCLSPSNYTILSYMNKKIQITPGIIFKIKGQMIEILNIAEQFSGIAHDDQSLRLFSTLSEEEPTLEYLPHQKSVTTLQNVSYMFLNGKKKNIKGYCNSLNTSIVLSSDHHFEIYFNIKDNLFYLPENTDILAKTANQVLSGHMSDKIPLDKNMKIKLQGIEFEILGITSKN